MAKRKIDLTEGEIIAWADSINGVAAKETAKKLGVHRDTVRSWRDKVQNFIGERVDLDDYRSPLYGLYPLALKSLVNNLAKCDVNTTNQYFRGMGIYVEKDEIEQLGRLTPDELDKLRDSILSDIQTRVESAVQNRPAEGEEEPGGEDLHVDTDEAATE